MKRREIAVLLSICIVCIVGIAAFGTWTAREYTSSADSESETKYVRGLIPVSFDEEESELLDQVEYSAEPLMIKFKKPFDGRVDNELNRTGIVKLDALVEMEDYIWYIAYINKDADVDKVLKEVREDKKVAEAGNIISYYNGWSYLGVGQPWKWIIK